MGSEGEMEEGVGWAEPTHTVQAEESGLERYMNKICICQQELSELLGETNLLKLTKIMVRL